MSADTTLPLRLNGTPREARIDARSLLVDVIRDLGARSARVGCHTGDCGACSVLLDGALVKSCLVLAIAVPDGEVTTLEGCDTPLAARLREAFVARKGFQCGYCTSGMILTAIELLERNPAPMEREIRHAISGNLCRCTGYESIVDAILDAADVGRSRERDEAGRTGTTS